jgi:hypothetical protein
VVETFLPFVLIYIRPSNVHLFPGTADNVIPDPVP